jgi:hypothetical protein
VLVYTWEAALGFLTGGIERVVSRYLDLELLSASHELATQISYANEESLELGVWQDRIVERARNQ